jgi:hypothetical protein
MGRTNPASNRDGHVELDQLYRLPVQEREAVYSLRHCSGVASSFFFALPRAFRSSMLPSYFWCSYTYIFQIQL